MVKKLSYLKFFPIFAMHRVLGVNLYTYLVGHILGLVAIVHKRRFPSVFMPMALVFILSALFYFIGGNISQGIRTLFPIFTMGLFVYFQEYFHDREIKTFCLSVLVLSIIMIVAEFFWGHYLAPKNILPFINITVPRYDGITGFSNFTAVGLATIIFIFTHFKRYSLALLTMIPMLLSYSKTSLAILAFGFLGYFFEKIKFPFKKMLSLLVFIMIYLSPLLLTITEKVANEPIKQKINQLTSSRYVIQLSFIEMWKDNPYIGIGYQQGHKEFYRYMNSGSSLIENKTAQMPFDDIDPHSTFVQWLVEFGILGYLLLGVSLFWLFNKIYVVSFTATWMYLSLLLAQTTLFGLSEFFFYLFLSCVLRKSKSND